MLKIGLTGGIGSGKTTVANLFAEQGIKVIDSDIIARNLVTPSQPTYNEVIKKFGKDILLNSGEINRKKVGKIIFNDPELKIWLENLLHPLIKKEIEQRSQNAQPYCIVVIPLLVETKSYDLVDRILVIDTSINEQIIRTQQRDNLPAEHVMKIINNQATRDARLEVADDIIYNTGDIEDLKDQVKEKHFFYLSISSN